MRTILKFVVCIPVVGAILACAPPSVAEDALTVCLNADLTAEMRSATCRVAAEQGHAEAMIQLGRMYQMGHGVPQDDVEAGVWHRRAAEQGDVLAQGSLGFMYSTGRGVPQDDAEAAAWYRRAAEQGDAPAQASLGLMYYEGGGVPQDYAEAAAWFRRAADQKYAPAQAFLGLMYTEGEGVPQDYVLAHMWLNLAGAGGHEEAREMRNKITEKMSREQVEEAQRLAREWKPGKP